jgi:HEAT repeat protein
MIVLCSQLYSQESANPVNARRLNTLRYGTDTEIAALIQTLRNEKDHTLDDSLIELFETSKNRNVLIGILSFFGEREESGLEGKAIRIIEERDFEANETVLAAVDYLGRVNAHSATGVLENLIRDGESRFLNNAIRALGRAARDSEDKDYTAQYLVNYYNTGNPNNENQREIIVALGETGSSEGIAFLSGLVRNSEERYVLRMAALDALGKIGDPSGLDVIIEAVSTNDPNVRSSAIAALGPFTGEAADRAILEGLRDSYYRSRIGAAQAAGRRKMEAAVPYLQFRVENDDVQAVKDEAIKALGAIWNDEAIAILDTLFSEQKNSDTIRILAGEMLLTNNSALYTVRAIAALDDAKTRNQTALYNGFLRIVSPGISTDLEALARRFLATGSVIEKSYALDMAVNNNFTSLEEDIRSCLDERRNGASLARKAQTTLEKLGFTVE